MRRHLLVGTVVLGLVAAAHVGVAHAAAREHGYVTNTMQLPVTNTQAATFGRDLNGDRSRDNQLGKVFASLANNDFDLSARQNESITAGDLLMLHSLRTPSLANTRAATWQVLYGVPTADPDFDGGGTFDVASDQPRSPKLDAVIKNHHVKTVAGRIPVVLDFGSGGFALTMKKAKVAATCRASSCSNGRINGAIPMEEIDGTLLPAMVDWLQPIIDQDCPGTEPSSCMADSEGKTAQQLFDMDDDMRLTVDEMRDNSLMQSLLAPDLNLSTSIPGKDALSFGFGFTAVDAKLQR